MITNKYILYAGRLYKSKGIRVLLEAWKKINKFDLVICGTGSENEWCKNYIKENSITNIHMMGKKEKTELMSIMKNAEAVILPTQLYEGFPMTIAESFSNEVPVLVSDIGNANDIIQEKINGLHFNHKSSDDIARAVNELDTINWKEVMRVPKEYKPEENYKLLMRIYEDCIRANKKC